ncbi:MAG TPA: S1/P1 nuclease, partial [Rhizomicrobium sp.]|nr:S1/P1 nuclease [Rhizomicrobium sp.]
MNFRHFPSSASLLVSLLLAPVPAFAWGAEGHEIAAGVALRELTPTARIQVAHLLGGDAMLVQRSNWADEIKDQRRDTARWHFVDSPLQA